MLGMIFFYLLLTVTTAFVVAFFITLYQAAETTKSIVDKPDPVEPDIGLSPAECRKIVKRLRKESKHYKTYFGRPYIY